MFSTHTTFCCGVLYYTTVYRQLFFFFTWYMYLNYALLYLLFYCCYRHIAFASLNFGISDIWNTMGSFHLQPAIGTTGIPLPYFITQKLHSLAWESDRHVSATQVYCSIIFIPALNEPPQKKISKKRMRVVDRCVHSLVICCVPVAMNVPLNTTHRTVIVTVISCSETTARYSHITRYLL